MSRSYDYLTFDCYGTLVDWEGGIAAAFERALRAVGEPFDRSRVLRLYAEIEPLVEAETFRPYRQVLDETAARILERLGSAAARGRPFLSASLERWPPFADTGPALRRLHDAGYRLGILSNVDDDLLASTLRLLPVGFELLVTAERVRSYKPARAHFDAARSLIGRKRWLHAAQSLFHDVAPARELGIAVAWINRHAETAPPDLTPDAEYRNLTELAEALG